MGNWIQHPRYPEANIKMSNGLTIVVYSTLIVSMSKLAQSERDFDFYYWLADHDQTVFGIGNVSIDLDEMPWALENFDNEKQFILRVIEDAQKNLGYQIFDFGTHPEHLRGNLEDLRMLVMQLNKDDVENAPNREGYLFREVEKPKIKEKCSEHGIYKTIFGCYICNNW